LLFVIFEHYAILRARVMTWVKHERESRCTLAHAAEVGLCFVELALGNRQVGKPKQGELAQRMWRGKSATQVRRT
jgi:hypothetical protein